MVNKYVKISESISYQSIETKNYTLSSAQYMDLIIPNKNYKFVRDFLSRPLKRNDLGQEVGSNNYIKKSPFFFLRTKALQSYSYLPDITAETAIPIIPNAFVKQNLKEGDMLISKDSNIGEVVLLDKDYPNFMTSGAIYKLPIVENKYYLLAFLKHDFVREQLDFMVPKGATIRHAKTLFLDCKIPYPNQKEKETVKYIERLTQAIVNKEKLIKKRHKQILDLIEKELLENQKADKFNFELPKIKEIEEIGRLDTGLYNETYKKWNHLVKNYIFGSIDLISRGFDWARGTSLDNNSIKIRIDSDLYIDGFYELVLPTNISQYGFVEKSLYIGTPTKLKTISKGDIIFGGEGFGKGRTYVVVDDSKNVATNYHGIRIINKKDNLTESIFIRCFLAFWRSKGMIDYIGVGGAGGHCAPSYFSLIETPLFPKSKQEEIAKLYHNEKVSYETNNCTLDDFPKIDMKYNEHAGIVELDKGIKKLQEQLNKAIDNIVNDKEVNITFDFKEERNCQESCPYASL
jgi:type I restriction enzyme S subunit